MRFENGFDSTLPFTLHVHGGQIGSQRKTGQVLSRFHACHTHSPNPRMGWAISTAYCCCRFFCPPACLPLEGRNNKIGTSTRTCCRLLPGEEKYRYDDIYSSSSSSLPGNGLAALMAQMCRCDKRPSTSVQRLWLRCGRSVVRSVVLCVSL